MTAWPSLSQVFEDFRSWQLPYPPFVRPDARGPQGCPFTTTQLSLRHHDSFHPLVQETPPRGSLATRLGDSPSLTRSMESNVNASHPLLEVTFGDPTDVSPLREPSHVSFPLMDPSRRSPLVSVPLVPSCRQPTPA